MEKLADVDIEDLDYEGSENDEIANLGDGDIVISKKALAREK